MRSKYVLFLLSSLVFLMITGCQSKSEQIYNEFINNPDNAVTNMPESKEDETTNTAAPAVNEEISGDLVIYTAGPSGFNGLDSWFTYDFNKQYPNVHISFIGPNTKVLTDYYPQASVALASGTAGDIINLTLLPYTEYAQNGVLEDLYPFMENDPTFRKEDYYTNIFEALEYQDKLYGVPLGFDYWCYRFNKPLLEENNMDFSRIKTVNYKDVTDIYHKISMNNKDLILSKGWNQWIFEINELISYIDEKNNYANFNSKEFVDYLNAVKSIQWPESPDGIVGEDCQLFLGKSELCGFVYSDYNRQRNASLFTDEKGRLTEAIPASSSNGSNPFQANYFLGITSASKNKELAWLFIKSWLRERDIKDMDYDNEKSHYYIEGYSINRNNTLKLLEKAFGPGHEEEIAKINQWNSERNRTHMISDKDDLLTAIDEICGEFYAGRITAEDCAAQIQERVEILLKE